MAELTRRAFIGGVAAAAGAAAVSTSGCSGSRSPGTPASGFVHRTGQQLYLNGRPYRFIGFNIWRACITSWNHPPNDTRYFVNDGTTLAGSLAQINANGGKMNAFRTWFYQQFALNNGVRDWTALDRCLTVAGNAGFKVICTLQDQYNYEGTGYKDTTWYSTGYTSAVVPHETVPYRQWVNEVVNRYKNDDRILMWELINEPDVSAGAGSAGTGPADCPAADAQIFQAFRDDVAGLIKSIDSNHLVSLGTGYWGRCGMSGAGTGDDNHWAAAADSPQIDICSWHDYSGYRNAKGTAAGGNGLDSRWQDAARLNKPIYVGECGIKLNSYVGYSTSERASYLDHKMSAQFANYTNLAGHLSWEWDSRGTPPGTSYSYAANDPALAIMNKYTLT
ncbi:MAG TPA: cellulase family glycosylhydrolase [Streptosporangiaceae bacterium]